jgi:ACT domain-containing protein
MASQSFKIILSATSIPSRELKRRFENRTEGKEASIELELEPNISNTRGIDPTVLVAIVSVTGTALGALVSGLLQVALANRQQKIIIQGKDGSRLEVPSDTSSEKIDELIDKLRMMDVAHIHLAP